MNVLTPASAPSPEVTVLFCLVPSPGFSQRLGILYPTTCVGLGYGLTPQLNALRGLFPGAWVQPLRESFELSSSGLRCHRKGSFSPLSSPRPLTGSSVSPAQPSLLRHPPACGAGTGIFTRFPSDAPFGLSLGTDSPCPV